MENGVRTFAQEREVPLPRSRVWELVSNTDHFDQFLGLSPVQAAAADPDDTALVRRTRKTIAGFLHSEYDEYPYQWVQNERLSVLRVYDRGSLRRSWFAVELADAGAGTRVRTSFAVEPANPLGLAFGWLSGRLVARGMDRYLDSALRQEQAGQVSGLPRLISRVRVEEAALDQALSALQARPVRADLVGRLREHILTAGDEEVTSIRPFHLARAWGADRDEVLRLCLHATRAGLLRLKWQIMCPVCRVSKHDEATLAHITGEGHCDVCGIGFEANFDRYVELRFSVQPNIRPGEAAVYCTGSPARAAHILVQQPLLAGQEAAVVHPGGAGLRLRVVRLNQSVAFADEAVAGEGPLSLTYTDTGWSHDLLPSPRGPLQLHLRNRSTRDVLVVLERLDWDGDAVTAARVTAMQEFRDMFSSEVLSPGQQVGVESVSLLFTDLAGSTAMYEQVGDAPAYGKVRRHFDFLTEWIAANGGAVVKTIGDAVMAVFYSPEDAVKAALEIQSRVGGWNAERAGGEPITIKMGVHYGPAIAINSNERLDYFGRTVNIAARVQRESVGGDLVLSAEYAGRPGVQALLQEFGAATSTFAAKLKGIEGEFALTRVRITEGG